MPTARFATYPASVRLLFGIYSVCFLAGTYTHVVGLMRRGFLAFPVPLGIGVFWDALTLLDPLTVLLLWWHPKAGIRLGLAIMTADICVNTYAYLAGYWGPPAPNMVPLYLCYQALFGVFLFATAPLAFHRLATARGPQ
ncbi:hypothetical protein [Hymenobacter sp. UYCo722]|uniref:hypothetical protein n=1 Tax=Hymenobacter sp. UYCo722 TaxID=3156335 RepID=UPI00339A56BE